MMFELIQLNAAELREIAEAIAPAHLTQHLEPGALPPVFVAERALQSLSRGVAEVWACTFLIVRVADRRIVGGCGFKGAPIASRVEIGYAVAPTARRQGAATAAVVKLLNIAFQSGASEVLAEVAQDNVASARVVESAGFHRHGERIDEEGEQLIQWLAARDSGD